MLTSLYRFTEQYRYLLTFIFSLVASSVLVSQRILVNTDGVVYLAAAETLNNGNLDAALNISPNIFLPLLIALVSKITGGNLLLAADMINTLFFAGLSLSFVYLVKCLGGTARMQVIAAVLVILHPSLSGFRETIFRDTGFWMCCLFSLSLLCNYSRNQTKLAALFWVLSLVAASLFRPEAIAFFLAPLFFLFNTDSPVRERIRTSLLLIQYTALVGILALTILLVSGHADLLPTAIEHISRYREYNPAPAVAQLPEIISQVFTSFNPLSDPYPENAVWAGALLLLIPVFFSALLGALSAPYVILLFLCRKHLTRPRPHWPVTGGYCLLTAVVQIAFLLQSGFQTTRYLTLLSLFILALLPAALDKLINSTVNTHRTRIVILAGIAILAIDTFISFGHSKAYLSEGINWAAEHLPDNGMIISNERKITYTLEGRRDFDVTQLVYSAWRQEPGIRQQLNEYDYFLEDVFWDETPWLPELVPNAEMLETFTSERGNRLIIYKLR